MADLEFAKNPLVVYCFPPEARQAYSDARATFFEAMLKRDPSDTGSKAYEYGG